MKIFQIKDEYTLYSMKHKELGEEEQLQSSQEELKFRRRIIWSWAESASCILGASIGRHCCVGQQSCKPYTNVQIRTLMRNSARLLVTICYGIDTPAIDNYRRGTENGNPHGHTDVTRALDIHNSQDLQHIDTVTSYAWSPNPRKFYHYCHHLASPASRCRYMMRRGFENR